MKRALTILLILSATVCALLFCASCKGTFTVEYFAAEGGRIRGATKQSVESGEMTEEVEAEPSYGYLFVKWSDGVTSPKRSDKIGSCNSIYTALFSKKTYTVSYRAEEHGRIEGECEQTLLYEKYTSQVEAIPEKGYCFVEWSDGVDTPIRTVCVVRDETVSARFEEIVYDFFYDYVLASENCSEAEISVPYFSFSETRFAVPKREHFSFKGWYWGGESA